MGRKRVANLEKEYALEREIADLKNQVEKLKKQLREFEKSGTTKQEKLKPVKLEKGCPDCGASLKESEVPNVGVIELCAKACGFRNMRRKK